MNIILNECNNEIHFQNNNDKDYEGVAFLDRDGVVINEKVYIRDPKDVELNPGIKEVLTFLNLANYKIVIITNQSGIGRGLFGWNEYLGVTKRMIYLLGERIKINSIYACGSINENDCEWRKPGTGMIFAGWSRELLENKNSILIGDKSSDIEAGIRANIKNLFHVLTGHGESEKENVKSLIKISQYLYGGENLEGNLFFL